MTTEHDLDTRLLAARGVRAEDLPALPEAFLDYLHTSDSAQPVATAPSRLLSPVPAGTPASVLAAQQLVTDAHQRRTGATSLGRRRPGRRAMLRVSAAILAVAAAWTTALVVTPTERPDGGAAAPSESPVSSPVGIRLVAAEAATFPVSLEPAPEGLTPTFSRVGGTPTNQGHPLVYTADYFNATTGDRLLINLFPEDPRTRPDSGWSLEGDAAGTATVDGTTAELTRGNGFAEIIWQRPDGQWVRILGEDAYAETNALIAAAESLVDRPQPTGLQFGLAPAGWSLSNYEDSRSIDLTNDTNPEQMLRLSVYDPGPGTTINSLIDGTDFLAGPAEPVTIHGRPGWLALANGDAGSPDFWYTVGQLPQGQLFLLLAPLALTQEQVVQIADQVTYTP